MIIRLSHREAPVRGMMDLIVLGSNFSSDCRVLFRQVVILTDTSNGVYGHSGGFEGIKVVWKREARIDAGLLTEVGALNSLPPDIDFSHINVK